MKIAFVALPRQEDVHTNRIAPPLALAYVAAMLEQRRHIVRIYDLVLANETHVTSALAPLRSFRPHLVVIASDDPSAIGPVEALLHGEHATIVRLGTALRDGSITQAVAQALWYVGERTTRPSEESVIFEAMLALDDNLDALPFPARHLLSLEQYPLFTIGGELQTPVLVAQYVSPSYTAARNPVRVLAEVQSVMREHGIRHFVFTGAALTIDQQWMAELLYQLTAADLGARWEANIGYDIFTPELAEQCKQAGCESVCFEFVAGNVLVSREQRAVLTEAAQHAHGLGLGVRADIQLDPPYSMMPSLIDVSATLGLDAVHFHVLRAATADAPTQDGVSLEDIAEMARTRYRSSRSRQFFVERFGPQLGPMLWRVGRAGLLGRTWQRYADGADEGALAY